MVDRVNIPIFETRDRSKAVIIEQYSSRFSHLYFQKKLKGRKKTGHFLSSNFFPPNFPLFFFQEKQEKQEEQEIFPKFGHLTEEKI